MLQPAAAYQWLARLPPSEGKWEALKRPLFTTFLVGCTVSLIASGRLSLRLVTAGIVLGCFVTLVEIGALAAVWRIEQRLTFSQAVALFFMGHGPWSIWLLMLSVIYSFFPPIQAFVWAGTQSRLFTGILVVSWSGYVDFCFFRTVFQRSVGRSSRDLLLNRAICWSVIIAVFGGGPLQAEIMGILGV